MAIQLVREHINRAPDDHIFSTREFLQYAIRPTTDSSLSRLVNNGTLRRLSPGVFCKNLPGRPLPSVTDVARAKAAAFERRIVPISKAFARKLGFPINTDADAYFATDGRTTSFTLTEHGGYVQFIGIAPRKRALGERKVGVQLRTMWRVGAQLLQRATAEMITSVWTPAENNECASFTKQLPQWLTEWLLFNRMPRDRPIRAPA